MLIDINALDNGRSKAVSFTGKFIIPPEYNLSGNVLESNVEGTVTKSGDVYEFRGRLIATAKFECAKCLAPVSYSFDIELDESFSNAEHAAGPSGESEAWTFKGTMIDLTQAVLSNIFLAVPYRVVCGEGCKGICPVCGHNLNDGECGCDRSQPDSRFESLRSFFDVEKEV